ncbi:MAG: hypothetical protein QXW71_05675, partial [Thermoplasmata archaeon]
MFKKKFRSFTAVILMIVFFTGSVFTTPMKAMNAQTNGQEENDLLYHFEENNHGFAGNAQKDTSRAYKGQGSLKITNVDSGGKAWTGIGDEDGYKPILIYPNNIVQMAVFIPE